uniref:Uncharacterized protein n=1 Tax=Clandestinovirus TaxID=2831644 RepID=A0A8F8KNX4_9VIRU|nr:hypothetical protein KOM_12_342 [Clandestinovirus]
MSEDIAKVFNHPFFWGKTPDEKQYIYTVWTMRAKRDASLVLPWTESYRKYHEKISRERLQRQKAIQHQQTIDKHPMAETIKAMRRVFEANFGDSEENAMNSDVKDSDQDSSKATNIISKGVWGHGVRAAIKRGIITAKKKPIVSADEKISSHLERGLSEEIASFDMPPIFQSPSEWRSSLIKQCQNDFEMDKKRRVVPKTARPPDFTAVENPIVLKRANTIATALLKEKPILDDQLNSSMMNVTKLEDFMWLVSVDIGKFGRSWYNPITWLGRIALLPSRSGSGVDYGKSVRGYLNMEKLTIPQLEKTPDHLLSKKYYHPETTSFVIKLTDRSKYCWIHFDRFMFTLIRWVQERQKMCRQSSKTILRSWIQEAEKMVDLNPIINYWTQVKLIVETDDKCTEYGDLLCTALVTPIGNLALTKLPESIVQ